MKVLTTETLSIPIAAVFGLILGSFMNVVIHRLPRGKSIAGPRSMCPKCKHTVAWYDNVPVLSYLLLAGRCRSCRWRIPARYPVVEILSGAAAAGVVWYRGMTLEAAIIYAFVAIMVVITFIDWEHQIIPDALSLGGVVLGYAAAFVRPDIDIWQSLLGSVVGAGVVLVIAVVYKLVRKVHGMGGGDVKLMAMIGAFLGWQMVFSVLFTAALFGSLYGIYLMRSGGTGKTAVAFGSFLAPAACLMMFLGHKILAIYLGAY